MRIGQTGPPGGGQRFSAKTRATQTDKICEFQNRRQIKTVVKSKPSSTETVVKPKPSSNQNHRQLKPPTKIKFKILKFTVAYSQHLYESGVNAGLAPGGKVIEVY
jgi:hypothetical protein